ncbi:MAG: acyl-CoA dehydrogenase family protein, partial [Mycobacterium sp.]
MSAASISDEQTAARELVRSWASASETTAAARAVEHGDADAWQEPFRGLAELGLFGVAVPESLSGAGGGVADLCAMLEEAAYALVPGPVVTTALAALLVDDEQVLGNLMSGQRSAGLALEGDLRCESARVSGTLPVVLGAKPGEYVIADAGTQWLLVDTSNDGATVEPLTA